MSKANNPYPWYDVDEWDDLEQGDLLPGCPVLVPGEKFSERLLQITNDVKIDIPIGVKTYNVVIMSQSCDLARNLEQVLLCAHFPASDQKRDTRRSIRKSQKPAFHMLEKCEIEGFEFEQQIIDFRVLYTLPLDFVKTFTNSLGERIRILPPYKEHLSQSFARYFMRVGLPQEYADD